MRSFLKKLAWLYPLTPLGTLAAGAGLGLGISFFKTHNPLSLVFAAGFLAAVTAAVALGRAYAMRLRGAVLEWDSSAPLVAGDPETAQYVSLEGFSLFPLFNLHFRLTGKIRVGRDAYVHVREEQAVIQIKERRATLPFYFPLPGKLSARGSFLFRDILGLTRTNFGRVDERELPVLPKGSGARKMKEIKSSQGLEESVKKRSQDEERYFMREYMPGDRLRDINWKSSSRLARLITRIAPVTQEQTKSIVVFFRNIKPVPAAGLEAIAHLARAKSLLLSFLRHTKRASPEYVFQLVTAEDRHTLETEEEIERIAGRIAGWEYCPAPSISEYDPNAGEIFVFSTQYDRELPAFLGLFTHARVTAVQTVSAGKRERADHERFRFYSPFRPSLLPGRFAWRRDRPVRIMPPAGSERLVFERDLLEVSLW